MPHLNGLVYSFNMQCQMIFLSKKSRTFFTLKRFVAGVNSLMCSQMLFLRENIETITP